MRVPLWLTDVWFADMITEPVCKRGRTRSPVTAGQCAIEEGVTGSRHLDHGTWTCGGLPEQKERLVHRETTIGMCIYAWRSLPVCCGGVRTPHTHIYHLRYGVYTHVYVIYIYI